MYIDRLGSGFGFVHSLAVEVEHGPGSGGLRGLGRVDRGEPGGSVSQDVEVGGRGRPHSRGARVHVNLQRNITFLLLVS